MQRLFPTLPLYATLPTAQLLPFYDAEAIAPTLSAAAIGQTLPWRSPQTVAAGLTLEFWPAGHLPGAALACLRYTPPQLPVRGGQRAAGEADRTYTVVYTGDFSLSGSRLTDGLPLEELRGLKPDVLIIEGSYGTSRHPRRRQQENRLAEQIAAALDAKHSVLIPVPLVGLGQEILMLLRSHHQFTGRDLDIWVEARIADVCDRYLDFLPELPSSVQNFARHQPLFWDERVKPRVRRLQPNQRLTREQRPCIVLVQTQSNWGQYVRLPNSTWTLLLPQHLEPRQNTLSLDLLRSEPAFQQQSERSLRTLQTIAAEGNLQLGFYLLAEHCDGTGTTQLIHNLRPQHVVLIHGPTPYLSDLAALEELQNRYHLHLPSLGTPLQLPVSDRFLQPPTPEQSYGGELLETEDSLLLSLPDHITSDARWPKFAATGLVEVRWQGDDLIVRGISPRELLSQTESDRLPSRSESCSTCLYYRGQACRNQTSALYGFTVSPDGYCPGFESN